MLPASLPAARPEVSRHLGWDNLNRKCKVAAVPVHRHPCLHKTADKLGGADPVAGFNLPDCVPQLRGKTDGNLSIETSRTHKSFYSWGLPSSNEESSGFSDHRRPDKESTDESGNGGASWERRAGPHQRARYLPAR